MQANIRKGELKDVGPVLDLIKELAHYERCPQEVTVTAEDMIRDGFGENPIFNFFVAEENEKIIGLALYYIKYSTWKGKCVFLEDIIVTEEHRGQGLGKILFEKVAEVSRNLGVKRMEWQVLDWNEPAIKFYEKFNSHFDNDWINCKLSYEQLQAFHPGEKSSSAVQ